MDNPLILCRGTNIPLDIMNIMGTLLAGIAYGTFPRGLSHSREMTLSFRRYRRHFLLHRAMGGLIRPCPESHLAHIYGVLVAAIGFH